ncbi:hypothetical protein BH09PSE4_BH09PSE4_04320 [soil metagenome]
MSDPQAQPGKIADFLTMARPDGQFVLGAIPVEGGAPKVRTFDDAHKAGEWAATMNANRAHNLYWIHNRLSGDATSKPAEKDVDEVLFTHVDIDPRSPGKDATADEKAQWNETERNRILMELHAFQPKPTIVIDSGGGFQSFWRLEGAVVVGGAEELIADVKAYNIGLRNSFEAADSCQSLDHLMRLPFTVNWPDERKRKKGRTSRLASVVWCDGPVHPLHAFTPAPIKPTRTADATPAVERSDVRRLAHLDELAVWDIGEADRLRALIVQGCDPEKFNGDRSRVVFDLCCNLHRRGVPPGLIAGIISDPEWLISAHVIDKGGRDRIGYAWRQVDKAISKVADDREAKPRIVWSEVELGRCLDEAEAALIRSGLHVYQMGDRLVQVVIVPRASCDEAAIRRPGGSLVIANLPKHRLLEHFLSTSTFVKVSRLKDGSTKEVPFAPSLHFAETYMARHGAWRVPVLTGIATTPTMRTDGTVVAADGYDPASGLVIDTGGLAFPPVSEAPSKEEGRAALDVLVDVISEFPFVSDEDDGASGGARPSQSRSVALAMIITAVARPMFNAAPMFGISAPTMATGKSLLADVPAMIVTGRRATKMSQGASEEEDEKRLLSVLMHGAPVNVIDNIARPIEGDALCTILTEETWRCRVLGRSEMRDVGTRTLFIATGNNLSFRNDMASRAVLANLDAEVERPGERVFRRDLNTYVPDRRAELATAALTMLRAFISAGRPKAPGMKASRFEKWSDVRAALVWLGEPDPWKTNERVAVGDEVRAEHANLMQAIGAAFGFGEFLATTEIIERAHGNDAMATTLHLALATALPHGVSAPGLGRFLKKFADRRVDGKWIKASPNKKKGGRYAIMTNDVGVESDTGGAEVVPQFEFNR